MTEDAHLHAIHTLTDKITGLTLGAQGFDAHGDIMTGEDWRRQRDDVLEELIQACSALRYSRPVNGGTETIQ